MSLDKSRIRLSVLYFFEFCIFGGVVPVLSLYLKELPGFTGLKVGFVLSMTSVASITSPLIAQQIADRYISAEKLFSLSSYSMRHSYCNFQTADKFCSSNSFISAAYDISFPYISFA